MSNSRLTPISARHHRLHAVTFMTLILLALPMLAQGDDSGRAIPFNIPPQALSSALVQFADQGGVQFTAPGTLLQGLKTLGVHGNYAPPAALATMLRNTGLTYRFIDQRTVAISRPRMNPSQSPSTQAATPVRSGRLELKVSSSHGAPARMDPVTVQASEMRRALRRRVDDFVGAVLARPRNGPLYRWNIPTLWENVSICPVVAGLPKAAGALILQRISAAATYAATATYARFHLAGKGCHPNLYVVASDQPTPLLEKWRARNPLMYVTAFGIPPLERFIHSRRPIRAWYNIGLWCSGGTPVGWGNFPEAIEFSGPLGFDLPRCMVNGTRDALAQPTYGLPWSNITSAIIVIDLRRIKSITARQLVDYVALLSLTDVRLGAAPGSVPSILQLFGPGTPPQGLTQWDRALVYSLYDTNRDVLQMREIELDMVRLLTR